MTNFTDRVDLASERLGGAVISANDEFFAPKENLIKAERPIFVEGKYTDRGHWMDGWETRRRREAGHDWCILKLGVPGIIQGIVVDTAFFKGNFPEQCSLDASADGQSWTEILPQSKLRGDSLNPFEIRDTRRWSHVRLHIYPDGGVARLRVYGTVFPDLPVGSRADLAAVENGGLVVGANDMFFGSRHNLIMPGRAKNMGDGWETRRRRGPGHDWAMIQLGTCGTLDTVVVDTNHFKGNYPESCSLETGEGQEILPRSKLGPDAMHAFQLKAPPCGRVRLRIHPDGGVARLRLNGTVTMNPRLNTLDRKAAVEEFRRCCGSSRWAEQMADSRPFAHAAQAFETAYRAWMQIGPDDWLEAFRSHPKIGEKATGEQAGVAGAPTETLQELADLNRAYESKFGFIFLIFATGRSASEMLADLKRRIENDRETELRQAAWEQSEITRLRLEKLL